MQHWYVREDTELVSTFSLSLSLSLSLSVSVSVSVSVCLSLSLSRTGTHTCDAIVCNEPHPPRNQTDVPFSITPPIYGTLFGLGWEEAFDAAQPAAGHGVGGLRRVCKDAGGAGVGGGFAALAQGD